jgi:hypothetical protein
VSPSRLDHQTAAGGKTGLLWQRFHMFQQGRQNYVLKMKAFVLLVHWRVVLFHLHLFTFSSRKSFSASSSHLYLALPTYWLILRTFFSATFV